MQGCSCIAHGNQEFTEMEVAPLIIMSNNQPTKMLLPAPKLWTLLLDGLIQNERMLLVWHIKKAPFN